MSNAPDLGALYLQHRDALHKVAAGVLRNAGRADEAGDAVQEAIVSILASPPENVRSWEALLVSAVKRKAIDRLRSADVRHAGGELTDTAHDRMDDVDVADSVADRLDQQARARIVRSCLDVLDPRNRKAVWETVAMQRPRSEVAKELGVTPSRVSQMTTSSLATLQREMRRREDIDDELPRA